MSVVSYTSFKNSDLQLRYHDRNVLETSLRLSKNLKNTLLIDTLGYKLAEKGYSVLEKSYDHLILLRNEHFMFNKLTCRPLSVIGSKLNSQF